MSNDPDARSHVPRGSVAARWVGRLPPGILVGLVAAFTGAWTWAGWLRYETLHLSVYDFGLIYQEVWATAHGQSVWRLGAGAVHPLVLGFVPFTGLFATQSGFFLFLLAANSFAVAAAAFPLYAIVRDRGSSPWLALGIAGAYLAFPAVSGSVWFPVHLESFFPVLFLTGYWLYRRNLGPWAAVAWTAAMVTNVGAPVIVAAFAVGILVEPWVARRGWWDRLRGRPRPLMAPTPRRRTWLAVYLLVASVAVFAGIAAALIAYDGYSGFVQFLLQTPSSTASSTGTTGGGSWTILGRQAMTVALLLGPLLGLPLLGREERWAMLPFFAHALVLGSPGPFLWPFKDQYFCYILPGLFAAAVRGLDRPWRRTAAPVAEDRPVRPGRAFFLPGRSPATRWGVGLVVGVLAVGVVFAPWGPANPAIGTVYGLAQGSYDFPAVSTANATGVNAVRSLVEATPSTGDLLVQNNLPEPLDRFQYVIPGYHTSSQAVSHVLTDPYDPTFYDPNRFGPYPASMLQWADYYLATGATVVGESAGAMLLSVNASAAPPVYQPLRLDWSPGDFPCCDGGRLPSVPAPVPWISGPQLPFNGNYSVWSPGLFLLTVVFTEGGPNPTNAYSLELDYGSSVTAWANFSVSHVTPAHPAVFADPFRLSVPVYLPLMHLRLTVQYSSGPLQLTGIWLNQTAALGPQQLGAPWSTPPATGPAPAPAASPAAHAAAGPSVGAEAGALILGGSLLLGVVPGRRPPSKPPHFDAFGRAEWLSSNGGSRGTWSPLRPPPT